MKALRIAVVLITLCIGGCAQWNSQSGVDNAWRARDASDWMAGSTSEQDVTAVLGPPSQIIGLEDQTVFYYLREQQRGKGYILLLWNWMENKTTYDRAIFFFDKQGILTHYAYSNEALTYETD